MNIPCLKICHFSVPLAAFDLMIVEIEYTGYRKSSETCRYIFNILIYQYYTSTKHIIIISIVFKKDNSFVSPLFDRGGWVNFNFTNSSPYLVTYYWKSLLFRKIVTLLKLFYDISGWKGGMSIVGIALMLPGYYFPVRIAYTPENPTIDFILPCSKKTLP